MNIQPSDRLAALPKYAFKELRDKVKALRAAGAAVIDFGIGDPSEPTPDFVIESLVEAGRKHATTGYPMDFGTDEFKKTAAAYMQKRFGVTLDPMTEVCSNVGSKEAIFNFPEGFINPGDVVICPSPGYPPMKTGTLFAEGAPYFVPLLSENNFMIDYAAIPEEICEKAKIFWLNYPNSPTGAIADRAYYEGLVEWAKKHQIIIAADEGCYIDIYFDEKPISILEVAKEGIVAFYSMSKRNNMTGYRVGFVAGDSEIIKIFTALKANIDSGTPSIMQEAAIVALNDEEHVGKMRDLYREKGEILFAALEEMGLQVKRPKATFYVWQKVPEGMTDIEFATKLLDPEIAMVVTPGSVLSDICKITDENGNVKEINPGAGFVRFALMPTMEQMHESAKRLKKIQL